ncbi:MAG: hypothetical protein AB7S26_41460 [Sandaracinaceae bacterium]
MSTILERLVLMMGPGGPANVALRRDARMEMIRRLEPSLPAFGIPPGGHRREGRLDRRSVYAGPTTPKLYHKLELAFRTDGPPARTRDDVAGYHLNVLRAEPIYADVAFVTVVVLREHESGLRETSTALMSEAGGTYSFGGLDHLGSEMQRMDFVPGSVRARWRDLGSGTGQEPNGRQHEARPAVIPLGDQVVAYAGTVRLHAEMLDGGLERVLGLRAAEFIGWSTAERRAWTQLAFGKPHGNEYDPRRGPEQLASVRAGVRTVLGALLHYESIGHGRVEPSAIFTMPELARNASVRIARARAVESQLLDEYGLVAGTPMREAVGQ